MQKSGRVAVGPPAGVPRECSGQTGVPLPERGPARLRCCAAALQACLELLGLYAPVAVGVQAAEERQQPLHVVTLRLMVR